MKILLTGGSGDLGKVLACDLEKRGDEAIRFDIRKPDDNYPEYFPGSILDREKLTAALQGIDCIVHIAAWHGFHEFTRQKNNYDFWDVNITGTFNVFEAAREAGINKIIYISSEAIAEKNGIYGWTKVLGEQIAERFVQNHQMNVLTLRPRAFIPWWNKAVYKNFVEWAQWYWKGAVHINDVTQVVLLGIDFLFEKPLTQHVILPVDGAYEYTSQDLQNWDAEGAGSSFKKHYQKYYDLARQHGLDPTLKPVIQDISETKKILGYQPQYSLESLLQELEKFGVAGPAIPPN